MKGGKTTCPVTKTIVLLSDEWMMRVMHELLLGSKRFCELERSLPGISTRTLTLKLRKLEEDNMVFKSSDHYYEATEKGKGLRVIENAMKKYAEKYL